MMGAKDPRVRRDPQAGTTDLDLEAPLKLKNNGKVGLDLDGALYTNSNGRLEIYTSNGITTAPGSPLSIQLNLDQDSGLEITREKRVRARPKLSQVLNDSRTLSGHTARDTIETAQVSATAAQAAADAAQATADANATDITSLDGRLTTAETDLATNYGMGRILRDTSPTLTTPSLGVASGTSLATTGKVVSTGTAGIGYATGAGGTVPQNTSKSTGVTLNTICGQITMDGAALARATAVTFTVTNSTVASTDVVVVNHVSGGTSGAYLVSVSAVGSGSFAITLYNATTGSLSESPVIGFAVIKAVTA
jgi:hypothetical protein